MPDLKLRPVSAGDSKLLWQWANDPVVRESAFNTDNIPWEDHEKWFANKLNDPNCFIYLAEFEGSPAGQVRFDCEGNKAEVDIHLAPEARGKGIGTKLLTSGIEKLFAETDVQEIHSSVKTTNAPSSKMFLKAGFTDQGQTTMNGEEVFTYLLNRS